MTTAIVPYSKKIPLSKTSKKNNGKFAIVGYWWFEWLNIWTWQLLKCKSGCYARTTFWGKKEKRDIGMLMHRLMFNFPHGFVIDHADHDGLNNLEYNQRKCLEKFNSQNRRNKGISKYHGVHPYSCTVKGKTYYYYRSCIQIDGKRTSLGLFKFTENGERQAALAYNTSAKINFKEFANLNIIDPQDLVVVREKVNLSAVS